MGPHGPWLHFPSSPQRVLSFLSFKFYISFPENLKLMPVLFRRWHKHCLCEEFLSQVPSILVTPNHPAWFSKGKHKVEHSTKPHPLDGHSSVYCRHEMRPHDVPCWTATTFHTAQVKDVPEHSQSKLSGRTSCELQKDGLKVQIKVLAFSSKNFTSLRETHLLSTYLHDWMTGANQEHGTHSVCCTNQWMSGLSTEPWEQAVICTRY